MLFHSFHCLGGGLWRVLQVHILIWVLWNAIVVIFKILFNFLVADGGIVPN